ncbi:MAG: hypothetical protein KHW62_03720 [Clostridiales bacterium]|nr:hypothetical protein [Clostridiales bacterium]
MNKFIFGAKSQAPSNTKLTNGYTLFEWAMRQHCFPAFWGRSISEKNKITKDEIDFLSEKDCKILLIFDNLTEISVSSNNGANDAENAIESLEKLKVPKYKNIAVFAEIQDEWSVNHNWMISFAEILRHNGYIPGFIGNTDSSLNFNFNRQFSHYKEAGFDAVCCATKPETTETIYEWKPYAPSTMNPNDILLWQNQTKELNGVKYNFVHARNNDILKYTWAI